MGYNYVIMLKRWTIFGVLLVIFCADGRASQVQPKNNHQEPAAPVSTVPQQQENGAGLNGEKQKDIHADVKIVNPPEKDFYDKAPVWMNLALVVVALGTGIVIGWQSWETRKAAKGAQRAADASFAQIQLTKSKERARLRIEERPVEVQRLNAESWFLQNKIEFMNLGYSRAFILSSGWRFICKSGDEPLPTDKSDFVKFSIPLDIVDASLTPVEQIAISSDIPDDLEVFASDVSEGRKTLHLDLFIKYETMGSIFREDRGWDWIPIDPKGGVAEMLLGFRNTQTTEQRITDGYWRRDPKRCKSRYDIPQKPN
jgi:hypothetical protein